MLSVSVSLGVAGSGLFADSWSMMCAAQHSAKVEIQHLAGLHQEISCPDSSNEMAVEAPDLSPNTLKPPRQMHPLLQCCHINGEPCRPCLSAKSMS